MIHELIRFDDENLVELTEQYLDLPDKCPRHFALLSTAAYWSWAMFDKPLVVTSLYRGGDSGVHGSWRGTDLRISHRDRVIFEADEVGLSDDEASELVTRLNWAFQYIKSDGEPSQVAIIHGEGLNKHIHLQTPVGVQWLS